MNAQLPIRSAPTDSIFAVEGLRCAGCIAKLENGLAAVPGVESARVNFTHYCGRSDDVMPCELAQEFVRRAQRGGFNNHRVIEVGGASHQNLWQRLP